MCVHIVGRVRVDGMQERDREMWRVQLNIMMMFSVDVFVVWFSMQGMHKSSTFLCNFDVRNIFTEFVYCINNVCFLKISYLWFYSKRMVHVVILFK